MSFIRLPSVKLEHAAQQWAKQGRKGEALSLAGKIAFHQNVAKFD